MWFTAFVAVGMSMLAGAVLLPKYAALAALRARRDILAHHIGCEEKLAAYNERMIRAVQDDPVLIGRLMIRHGNYRQLGCESIKAESALPEMSVPTRLLQEVRNQPPRENHLMVRAGLWIDDPVTSSSMVLLALAMLAAGVVLFRPASLK